jgi:hypothetical protein
MRGNVSQERGEAGGAAGREGYCHGVGVNEPPQNFLERAP